MRRYVDNDDDNDDDDIRPPTSRRRRRYVSALDDDDDDRYAHATANIKTSYRRRLVTFDESDYCDPEIAMLTVLENIEYRRQQLQGDLANLQALLNRHRELQARWQEFTGAGGLSAKDFEQFIGGKWRPRIVRQRRHLRLVSNQKRPAAIRRHNNDGPEAA
jgi:hypothetical protein